MLHRTLFLFFSISLAQDGQMPADLRPEELEAEPALLSVDTKHAPAADVGLWRRDPDGTVYRIWNGSPYDSRWLVDRTILIAERWKGRIVHLDPNGEVLFERTGLAEPVDVELAHDGTYVVVERRKSRVVGIEPEHGRIIWTRGGFISPFDAAPLRDGGLLVADSDGGRVVELDPQGKLRWEFRTNFPNTVEPLEDGGVLISNWTGGDVIELGPDHKVRWRTHVGGTLYSAERMPNEVTVVSDGRGRRVLFLDPKGRVIKSERLGPGCVDYESILEL